MKAVITIKVDTKDENLISEMNLLEAQISTGEFQLDLKDGYENTSIKATFTKEQ